MPTRSGLVLVVAVVASACSARPARETLTHPRATTVAPMLVRAAPAEAAPVAPAEIAIAAGAAPRLAIVDARLEPTGECRPSRPMIEVHATVANLGDAAFAGSPGYGLVSAHMTKFGSMIGNGGAVPAIEAGRAVRIVIPVYFPIHDPSLVARAIRYELKLDLYGRYPAAQMDPGILVRTLPRPPCAVPGPRIAGD